MRDSFVKTLIEIAKEEPNVVLVTGDLGFGVLKPFWEAVPNQFVNAGIAEQNMTGVASGMALEGKTVVTYSIGNFPTLRCLEQIRNDAAYHKANVKVVAVGGGFTYGSLGMSHHATEDIAILRALPDVTIFSPGDAMEAAAATRAMLKTPGTCYLRLGRGGEKQVHEKLDDFSIGKALLIKNGYDIAVFSTGAILEEAVDACNRLRDIGIYPALYSFPTVKPIDSETIRKCAEEFKLIITVEEHNILGGFGGAVAEELAEIEYPHATLRRIGLNDQYSCIVGSQKFLRDKYNISADAIFDQAVTYVKADSESNKEDSDKIHLIKAI